MRGCSAGTASVSLLVFSPPLHFRCWANKRGSPGQCQHCLQRPHLLASHRNKRVFAEASLLAACLRLGRVTDHWFQCWIECTIHLTPYLLCACFASSLAVLKHTLCVGLIETQHFIDN